MQANLSLLLLLLLFLLSCSLQLQQLSRRFAFFTPIMWAGMETLCANCASLVLGSRSLLPLRPNADCKMRDRSFLARLRDAADSMANMDEKDVFRFSANNRFS